MRSGDCFNRVVIHCPLMKTHYRIRSPTILKHYENGAKAHKTWLTVAHRFLPPAFESLLYKHHSDYIHSQPYCRLVTPNFITVTLASMCCLQLLWSHRGYCQYNGVSAALTQNITSSAPKIGSSWLQHKHRSRTIQNACALKESRQYVQKPRAHCLCQLF